MQFNHLPSLRNILRSLKFWKNYKAFLSAWTKMTPTGMLKKEINRRLFEDAIDIVKLRVDQFQELTKGKN
jgi:oligoendopeptidase F